MRSPLWLAIGIGTGMAGWGLGHLLSGTFEPWDSGTGFLVTQVLLGAAAVAAAWRAGGLALCAVLLGGYLGLNLYANLFGSGATRAWWMLGALTSVFFTVIPAGGGVLALLRRRRKAQP